MYCKLGVFILKLTQGPGPHMGIGPENFQGFPDEWLHFYNPTNSTLLHTFMNAICCISDKRQSQSSWKKAIFLFGHSTWKQGFWTILQGRYLHIMVKSKNTLRKFISMANWGLMAEIVWGDTCPLYLNYQFYSLEIFIYVSFYPFPTCILY